MQLPAPLPTLVSKILWVSIAVWVSLSVLAFDLGSPGDRGPSISQAGAYDAKTTAARGADPDLNKTGRVDAVDLLEIVEDRRNVQPSIDLTGEGIVDGLDSLKFSKDWYRISVVSGPERAMVLAEDLQEPEAQARLDNENFPILMRPAMEEYYPEVGELIALGADAVEILLEEFRKPAVLLDDIPLSTYAFILEKIGDSSAVGVLADWLEENMFSEVFWATEFVTHAIKVLDGQAGLNTDTFFYNVDEKFDAIAQARVGKLLRSNLTCLTCKASGSQNNVCQSKILVTGLNSQGQQETIALHYKIAKRDIQDIIAAETDPTTKARYELRLRQWGEVDETVYGGSDYTPVAGSKISVKSNCAGTVIENLFNALASRNGIPLTLPPGQSDATALRNLAEKFGATVEIEGVDPFTVISHEDVNRDSKHVEVPVSSDANSAVVLSKDNYGKLRQHTISKNSNLNQFQPIEEHYDTRTWYGADSGNITTRFHRFDPDRILDIVLDRSRCPCDPNAPDAIPVAITQPTVSETTDRVITVAGTVGETNIASAALTLNGAPQTIAVANGAFSVQVVLSSGDNLIGITVESPDGCRGFTEKSIRSTTPKSTISVTLTWNLNDTDVDLYVTQPDDVTVWYSNNSSSIGGVLDVDNTRGFGPENYFLSSEGGDMVLEGPYTIGVHYYDDDRDVGEIPTRTVTWRVVIVLNEGTEHESRKIFSGNLSTADFSNDSPGSSGPDWAAVTTLNFTLPAP